MAILLSMNMRGSMRARMFGMTMAIPNTMTIGRTMRSEEGIRISTMD